MKIHEYQAKEILAKYGVAVPKGEMANTPEEAAAEARKLFERLLSRCNDVGLLSEEIDPTTGRMLGNFPQAYSHVGLINCALSLSRQMGPIEERAESQAPPNPIAPSAA